MAAGDPTASEREPFPPSTRIRDHYVDSLRSFSLLIVVLWHWAFTVVIWEADGPHAGNPIGTTQGFWALTWLLQVMPVFFFVGGFAHLRTWSWCSARAADTPPSWPGGYAGSYRRLQWRCWSPWSSG